MKPSKWWIDKRKAIDNEDEIENIEEEEHVGNDGVVVGMTLKMMVIFLKSTWRMNRGNWS